MSDTRVYPIDNERRKGFYVAKLDGPDDKYIVNREFLTGMKRGRAWEYTPDDVGQLPAWIIRVGGWCDHCDRPNPKVVELIAAYPHGWRIVGTGFTSADLLAVWESGEPRDDTETQVAEALAPERVEVYAADKEVPF